LLLTILLHYFTATMLYYNRLRRGEPGLAVLCSLPSAVKVECVLASCENVCSCSLKTISIWCSIGAQRGAVLLFTVQVLISGRNVSQLSCVTWCYPPPSTETATWGGLDLGSAGFWNGDYGWGVRVRRHFGARGKSSVRYGTRLGDLQENWFLLFSN